jgi:hypothetical protein
MRPPFLAFLLLYFVALPVLAEANPGDPVQVSPLQHHSAMQHGDPQTAQAQAQVERRRIPQFELPDPGAYLQSGPEGDASDGGRKSGKLSAEERRALRRQINEAGNDLYLPRR